MTSSQIAAHPGTGGSFDVRVVDCWGAVHLDLIGDLDATAVAAFSAAIERFLSGHTGGCRVAVDLAELTYLDSDGVRAVEAACELLRAGGYAVSLRPAGRSVDRITPLRPGKERPVRVRPPSTRDTEAS